MTDTPRMIFVNLPVTDLARSMEFYAALGFTNEPRFTDDTAACMVWSEAIFVMILTHAKWRDFTDRPIPPTTSSEVSLALALDNRDAVDAMVAAGPSWRYGRPHSGPGSRLHVRPRPVRPRRPCLGADVEREEESRVGKEGG